MQLHENSNKYIYLREDCCMILKLVKYSLTMLVCCITLISCGQENTSTNKLDISKKENYSTGIPDIIENSLLPTQTPKKSKDSNKSKRRDIEKIYGKWKILVRYLRNKFVILRCRNRPGSCRA